VRTPPSPAAHVRHVYNQFMIADPNRDALREHLASAGIPTALYYTPCHVQPLYAGPAQPHLPVAEEWAGTALALPMYPELSMQAVDDVCAEIRAFANSQA
jgi:dTDP-4-amino-4,6-dideoxygalactose transaminase